MDKTEGWPRPPPRKPSLPLPLPLPPSPRRLPRIQPPSAAEGEESLPPPLPPPRPPSPAPRPVHLLLTSLWPLLPLLLLLLLLLLQHRDLLPAAAVAVVKVVWGCRQNKRYWTTRRSCVTLPFPPSSTRRRHWPLTGWRRRSGSSRVSERRKGGRKEGGRQEMGL